MWLCRQPIVKTCPFDFFLQNSSTNFNQLLPHLTRQQMGLLSTKSKATNLTVRVYLDRLERHNLVPTQLKRTWQLGMCMTYRFPNLAAKVGCLKLG